MNGKISKMEQKLDLYATEESVSDRLKKKSSIYDFGAQAKQLADMRCAINPLMEHRTILTKLIETANEEVEKENRTEFFAKKLEQIEFKLKTVSEN